MVRCDCGQQADPDWGQCYECWLRDRPRESDADAELRAAYAAEQQAEYEAEMWRQYTTGLWGEALAAGETQLAQPGEEA